MVASNIPTPPEGLPSNIQAQQAAAHAGISEGVQQLVRKHYTGPKRDRLVQATRGLRKPTGKKSIANDPLQSDFIGEPAEPPSATEGYPFPQPGLAYYMAEAMVINVQADSEMMMAYNSEENVFYKSIEHQWDIFAQKDQEYLEQQGQQEIIAGSFAVASGVLAFGMAGYMGWKSKDFTEEQTALTGEKSAYTAQLGEQTALATSISGDQEAIEALAGEEGSPAELSTQERQIREDYQSAKDQLLAERDAALNPESMTAADYRDTIDAKYERLEAESNAKFNRAEAEANEAYRTRVTDIANTDYGDDDTHLDDIAQAEDDRDAALQRAEQTRQLERGQLRQSKDVELVQHPGMGELEGVDVDAQGFEAPDPKAVNADYEEKLADLKENRDDQLGEIEQKRETFKNLREDVSDKLSELEKRRTEHGAKMGSLQAIPQVVSSFAGLGQGVIKLQSQAVTLKTKDTADKIKSINQTALQGLIRQWNTLAGYVDQTFPAYVDAIKSFNQALQRV